MGPERAKIASTRVENFTSAISECRCVRVSLCVNDFDAPLNMPAKSQTRSPSILYRLGIKIENEYQHNEAEDQEPSKELGM